MLEQNENLLLKMNILCLISQYLAIMCARMHSTIIRISLSLAEVFHYRTLTCLRDVQTRLAQPNFQIGINDKFEIEMHIFYVILLIL